MKKIPEKKCRNRFWSRVAAVGALWLAFGAATAAAAATLAEYRADVRAARGAVQGLVELNDRRIAGAAADPAAERELLGTARARLPAGQKVVWNGTEFEVDNRWLTTALKTFEEKAAAPRARRPELIAAAERLAAVESQLDEILGANAAAAGGPSKDEEKRRLGEILRRPEYLKPEARQESFFQRLQRQLDEWLRDKFPQPEIPETAGESVKTLSFWMQILLYALLLGFIAFLIYRFAPLFRRRQRRTAERGERVILGETLAPDEDSRTLFDEAESLARRGDLRGAIRKGYIAVLCELGDRRLIALAGHKTNRDYLRAVRKKPVLYETLGGLTASFERHWYGFGQTGENDWQEFKELYRRTLEKES